MKYCLCLPLSLTPHFLSTGGGREGGVKGGVETAGAENVKFARRKKERRYTVSQCLCWRDTVALVKNRKRGEQSANTKKLQSRRIPPIFSCPSVHRDGCCCVEGRKDECKDRRKEASPNWHLLLMDPEF